MLLRGQAESARGGEIEAARIARDLPDDAGEIAAAQAFLKREQRVFGRTRGDVNQPLAQVARQAV